MAEWQDRSILCGQLGQLLSTSHLFTCRERARLQLGRFGQNALDNTVTIVGPFEMPQRGLLTVDA